MARKSRLGRYLDGFLTDAEFRTAVLNRSPWCEARWDDRCTGRADHAHHVLPKGRGGKNTLSNGLAVCWTCHATIHAWPAASEAKGFMLPSQPTRARYL